MPLEQLAIAILERERARIEYMPGAGPGLITDN
jgi:hypothetical protein